ncbi:fasciclin domain-containing protein [Arenimonas composti]|uniref:FAS1 domain-containing protein n=1 Tax=Arenimonas composti TR7-09 = DSM 18010 TaxID=1121013 RepID=A0A091BAF4_9GAMM|nr:fasciclin domain-containing protein [Arenimonas composti]KFN48726.1 hypothetical protein P873_13800 [Arenimonas composti TR7-09 = DSM 18010]
MKNPSSTSVPNAVTPPVAPAANPGVPTLLQNAASNGSFKTFGRAVEQAGLTETLSAPGPFTVFAPTDAAFEQLPAGKLEFLFQPENKPELAALINGHLLRGRKGVAEIGKWPSAKMIGGGTTPVTTVDGKLAVGRARITVADIDSSNGYLHGIDKVNLPTRQ